MSEDEVLVALTKQIAALAAIGTSTNQISQQLSLTRPQVKRILASPQCALLIRGIGEHSLNTAIAEIKTRTAGLVDKALAALEHNLDKNELEAVKLIFRTVGVLDPAETKQVDTQITIVAPGGTRVSKDVIESEFTVVEEPENDQ